MELVRPIALVFWAFWRLLQVIDQRIYWGALIFSAVFYAFYRLTHETNHVTPENQSGSNIIMENLSYWRDAILFTCDEIDRDNILKQNLGKMLASIYTAQQPGIANIDIYSALHRRELILPKNIYAFLFPAEDAKASRSFASRLGALQRSFRNLIRRLSRRDVAEYYQSIDEVLTFMEMTIEDNHDNH